MANDDSSAERLELLQRQLNALEQSTAVRTLPTSPPPKPARIRIAPKPWQKAVLIAMQCWCGLIFLLMVYQSDGQTPVWQWLLLGLFVVALGLGAYGIFMFYILLGKSVARALSRRLGRNRDDQA